MFPKSDEYRVRFDTCCVECEDSVLYPKPSDWNKGYLGNNLQCYTIPPGLYMTTTDTKVQYVMTMLKSLIPAHADDLSNDPDVYHH